VPNFINIGQKIAEIWRIKGFQSGGRPPSWTFQKFEILTVDALYVANTPHLAIFRQNPSNGCRYMVI